MSSSANKAPAASSPSYFSHPANFPGLHDLNANPSHPLFRASSGFKSPVADSKTKQRLNQGRLQPPMKSTSIPGYRQTLQQRFKLQCQELEQKVPLDPTVSSKDENTTEEKLQMVFRLLFINFRL